MIKADRGDEAQVMLRSLGMVSTRVGLKINQEDTHDKPYGEQRHSLD